MDKTISNFLATMYERVKSAEEKELMNRVNKKVAEKLELLVKQAIISLDDAIDFSKQMGIKFSWLTPPRKKKITNKSDTVKSDTVHRCSCSFGG